MLSTFSLIIPAFGPACLAKAEEEKSDQEQFGILHVIFSRIRLNGIFWFVLLNIIE
jgi:hypothetical protein